jgi:hypothetical protein
MIFEEFLTQEANKMAQPQPLNKTGDRSVKWAGGGADGGFPVLGTTNHGSSSPAKLLYTLWVLTKAPA